MDCTASDNARYWGFFHTRAGANATRVIERVDTTGHARRVIDMPKDVTLRKCVATRSSVAHFVIPVRIEDVDRVPPEWRKVHFSGV